MNRLVGALLFLTVFGGQVFAQPPDGHDKQSDGRFTGIAMITDDVSWYDLFARPEAPQISGRDVFTPGVRGSLVLIFSNAEARDGNAQVECDITAFYPEGKRVVVVEGGVCYQGPYRGDGILHPALIDLQFEVEAGDPAGRSGFEITMRDDNSNREVELTVAYTQEQAE